MNETEQHLQHENTVLRNTIADMIAGNVVLRDRIKSLEIQLGGAMLAVKSLSPPKRKKARVKKQAATVSSVEIIYL